MENKLTWDYLGHREHVAYNDFQFQKDWNQTIVTKINQLSTQIHMSTLIGGDNKIKIHPRLLLLFDTMEYFRTSEDGKMTLAGKYEFILDDSQEKNTLLLYHETDEFKRLKESNLVMVIKVDGSEHTILFVKNGSYEHTLAISDPKCKVITEDKLRGEIEILNYE
jgi:hypothetical protein